MLKEKMSNVRNYIKEHKTGIIIGSVALTAGAVLSVKGAKRLEGYFKGYIAGYVKKNNEIIWKELDRLDNNAVLLRQVSRDNLKRDYAILEALKTSLEKCETEEIESLVKEFSDTELRKDAMKAITEMLEVIAINKNQIK